MQKDKIDEICTKMGAIFHTENKRVRINEPCLCELFKESGIYCYIRPLKIFEYYDHTTGKTVRISEDEIRTRLRTFAAGLRGNISITNINLALSYRVLCSALQMFKDAVGTDIYPEATRFCIHTRNGILVYDQELKNFRLCDFSPEIISRSMINRVYNPKAECPMFIEKLLKPMLLHPEDDLDTLQQLFGQYLLRENLSQQFLVISGPAGVGKSVLVSIIERILGLENITEFQPSRLSNPFEMVEYSNKHLLTAKDVENDALSKGINALKKITGNDYLALEKKHSNERVYVRGNFNIIITGNGDLTIDFGAGRDAFARRLIWVECKVPEKFERITDFDKLLVDEEGDGIFAWGVAGACKLLNNGGIITKTERQKKAVEYLLDESAPVESFIRKCVVPVAGNGIASADLTAAFYKYSHQARWNSTAVLSLTPRQVEQRIRQAMLSSPHKFRYSTNIEIQGMKKRVRGYMNCKLKFPTVKS